MKLLLVLVTLFIAKIALSQTGSISGKITDTSFTKAKVYATITVFKAMDTTIVTYRLSNEKGEFKIPGLPLNIPLRFIVSFSGFNTYRKQFILTEANSQLKFDSVALTASTNELAEVLIISERPPVMIKKDTIEFNANAFKTLPNALVEDLLKKLPGVNVDAEGNITVNGKPVNKILVDGKSFFGDDPKMASRNLPANVIDKVQVMDDKEQIERNGDDNLNNVGKVVNITLKKGVKKGWFGKLFSGGGTKNLYDVGGIANIYRDTLQVSVLGYINNLNKTSFGYQEIMQTGGFDRNRSNSNGTSTNNWVSGTGNGLSVNGINFGGMQGNSGIATSKGVGININHTPNTKRSFFTQYFYGNVLVDRKNETDVKQYYNDTIVNNRTLLYADVVTNAHNIGIGLRLRPDSVTNILFNANYTIGHTNENRYSDVNSINSKLGNLSFGNIYQYNNSATYFYRHNVNYTRLSKTKKGRRLSVSQSLDINNRINDYLTESATSLLYPIPLVQNLNQLRKDRLPRTDASAGFTYSEPVNKVITLRITSRYEYGKNKNQVNTYNKGINNYYDVLNALYSSNLNRETSRFSNSIGMEYKTKNFTITPTVRTNWQKNNTSLLTLANPIKQNLFNVLPALTVVYKKLNISYDKSIALPSYSYLIAVNDNSNPYFITKANPGLLPSTRDIFYINLYTNDMKRNLYVGGNGSITLTKNDIIQNIVLDNKGIQTVTPVNANGSRNFWLNYNVNKQYKYKQQFTFSWNHGAYYNFTRSRLLFNTQSSWQSTWQMANWVGLQLNWNDVFEWNNTYTIGNNFTRYTTSTFKNLNINTHDLNTELILRHPKHIIWETKINYTKYGNTVAGLPNQVVRWNAGVNYTFLKNEVGVLNFKVYDLLNQNNFLNTNASRNMIITTNTNVLPKYYMLTFTYNVRANGVKKKVGGSLFQF